MKKSLICLIVFFCFYTKNNAQQTRHSFEIKKGNFYFDDQPIQIHSGEMHFARIPHQYWRHRLQMLKAMGLNAVASYVFWNYHNTAPGVWDFETGNKNIRAFIKTAQEEGLMVILRPGPYACAEWEFGGYPWWLQKENKLVIRTYNQPFLDSCRQYISKLATQVKPLLVTNGGPVIMVQAENEFGSYVAQRKDIPLEEHKRYNSAIRDMLISEGINVPLFTSDGSWLFEGGSLPGVLPTANGEGDVGNLKKTINQYNNNEGPYMVAEYYPGWLHHWAEPFPNVPTEEVTGQLQKYLTNDVSFNIYMAHGGTNFGFTSGANYDKGHDIQPDLTSYDYDAPISEAGWATPKFMAIRELLKKYVKYPVPGVPKQVPVITIPPIRLPVSGDALEWIKKSAPVISDTVLSFEDLNQGSGYVLYSKKFTAPVKGTLQLKGLRDYAVIYVNGIRKAILNRMYNQYSISIDIPANAVVDILVENMGRINYGARIIDNKKGIIAPVLIDDLPVTGEWKMYKIPFEKTADLDGLKQTPQAGRPALYQGSFRLKNTGDVFLDMSKWGKGILFVNGYNLGRYWNIGPQQTLYVPGAFLKKGNNKIFVFEQLNDAVAPVIPSVSEPVLKELKLPK